MEEFMEHMSDIEREELMVQLRDNNYEGRRGKVVNDISVLRNNLNGLLNRVDYLEDLITPAVRAELQNCADILQAVRCKPVQIGMTGMVAVGKSTFLNSLLRAEVLPRGNDSTTALPTYISYDADKYSVTVEYFCQEDVTELLKSFILSFDNTTSNEHKALKSLLSHIFHPRPLPSPKAAESLLAENKDYFQYVDHASDVLYEGDSSEGVLPAVARAATRQSGVNAQIYIVAKRISISGPFETLPPGVTIVDTPGLGDRRGINPLRTVNSIRYFDEVWHAAAVSASLSSPENDLVLKEILAHHQDNITRNITLRILLTMANVTLGDNRVGAAPVADSAPAAIRKYLLSFFIALELGLPYTDVADAIEFESEGAIAIYPEDVVARAQARSLAKVRHIDLVGSPDDSDFTAFHGALLIAGQKTSTELTDAENILQDIRARINQLGITALYNDHLVRVRRLREEFTARITEFRNFDVQGHEFNHQQLTNDIWRKGIYHHNTIKAAMDPARQGRFIGTGTVFKPQVDINRDIAELWMRNTTNIVDLLSDLHRSTAETLGNLVPNPPIGLARLSIGQSKFVSDEFTTMIANCFRGNVTQAVQQWLFYHRVYAWGGRNTLPTDQELVAVLTYLVYNSRLGLDCLVIMMNRICDALSAYGQPQDVLPLELRTALDDALVIPVDIVGGGVPPGIRPIEDCTCGICLELYTDPVQLACRHVFCRGCINDWLERGNHHRCPLRCHVEVINQQMLPRTDLLLSIDYWRQQERLAAVPAMAVPEAPAVGELWYNTVWRENAAQYRDRTENAALP
jgi:hypothetical protein